jgi:hypothetical protein
MMGTSRLKLMVQGVQSWLWNISAHKSKLTKERGAGAQGAALTLAAGLGHNNGGLMCPGIFTTCIRDAFVGIASARASVLHLLASYCHQCCCYLPSSQ